MNQEQKRVREEICKRWESMGITKGMNGKISEEMRKLFESVSKQLPKEE